MQNGELSETLTAFPANPYGYAKDALRRQLEFLQAQMPFDLSWARLFYMYGEGQSGKSIFSLLSAAAERGDTYFDMSGGEQIRDYLRIDEVATFLVRLSCLQRNSGIVNVCSGAPRSMRGIVESWLNENHWRYRTAPGASSLSRLRAFCFLGKRAQASFALGRLKCGPESMRVCLPQRAGVFDPTQYPSATAVA